MDSATIDPTLMPNTIGMVLGQKTPPSRYGSAGCKSRVVGAIPEWGHNEKGEWVPIGIRALVVRSHDMQSRIDRHQRYCDKNGKPFQARP